MPTSERRNRRQQEHLTDAELNELVDGTLSGDREEIARAHLATCTECDQRSHTLRATISALQNAPSVVPRRSFQLMPEQAKFPERKITWHDRVSEWIIPGVPAIRAATIVIALLLVSVTAFDVFTQQSNPGDQNAVTTMQRTSDAERAAPAIQSNQTLPTEVDSESARGGTSSGEQAFEAAPVPASVSNGAADMAPAMAGATVGETPAANPIATASPVPTVSSEESSSTSGLSRWRLAEFGLVLLLIWLAVTWFGRTRMSDRSESDAD